MKVSKAIEILTFFLKYQYQWDTPDADVAMKLGIEALKRIAKEREFPHVHIGTELPGETPEEEV